MDENGEFAEALPLARRALERREQGLGPDHPDTVASRVVGEHGDIRARAFVAA